MPPAQRNHRRARSKCPCSVLISPRATEDLLEIWSYIADDSVANADAFIDKLNETMQLLARRPGSGRHREELAPEIHSFPCSPYVIFYRAIAGTIEIVRVLHGARDIENIFDSGREDNS